MKISFLAPVLLLLLGGKGRVGGVFAQTTTTSTGTGTSFSVGSVPVETRTTWCKSQTDTCGTLCGGKAKEDSCDPDSLTYSCICVSGIIPPLSNYQSTIPYFICQQTFIDCTTANPGDISQCASTCGTLQPSAIPGANIATTSAAGALQTAGGNASKTSTKTSAVKSTGTSAAATATQSSGKSSSRGVSTGAVAGIAIGGAAVAIVGTTAVIWFIFRRKYGKGRRKAKRESEVFGFDGRYKELDTVRGHPGVLGRFEKDGAGGQVHEMGAVGRDAPPRPPRPDAELDSGSLDWVELPSGR